MNHLLYTPPTQIRIQIFSMSYIIDCHVFVSAEEDFHPINEGFRPNNFFLVVLCIGLPDL